MYSIKGVLFFLSLLATAAHGMERLKPQDQKDFELTTLCKRYIDEHNIKAVHAAIDKSKKNPSNGTYQITDRDEQWLEAIQILINNKTEVLSLQQPETSLGLDTASDFFWFCSSSSVFGFSLVGLALSPTAKKTAAIMALLAARVAYTSYQNIENNSPESFQAKINDLNGLSVFLSNLRSQIPLPIQKPIAQPQRRNTETPT